MSHDLTSKYFRYKSEGSYQEIFQTFGETIRIAGQK
jgi:hypothetical protein